MSYKAFAALKKHLELEAIKNMSPEEINGVLTKQHSQIEALERQNAEMLELLKTLEYANLTWDGPECAICGHQSGHAEDCELGNLLARFDN